MAKILHTACIYVRDDITDYRSAWLRIENETIGHWFGCSNWRVVGTTAVAIGNFMWLTITSEGEP